MLNADFDTAAHEPGWVRTTKTVLLLLPDGMVRELIADALRRAGCYPLPVAALDEARRLLAQVLPDAIVLDLDADAGDAAHWAAEVVAASRHKSVRTVMLSAHSAQACADDGSRCGADLCVAKPVEPRSFVHNVLRLLRTPRAAPPRQRPKAPLNLANLEAEREFPMVRLRVAGHWHTIDLSPTEHRTLLALLDARPRVMRREALRQAAWGDEPVGLRTVDQSIKRLRALLEQAGARGVVRTVSGSGYRIDLDLLDSALADRPSAKETT